MDAVLPDCQLLKRRGKRKGRSADEKGRGEARGGGEGEIVAKNLSFGATLYNVLVSSTDFWNVRLLYRA